MPFSLSKYSGFSSHLVRTFLARITEVNDRTQAVAELSPNAFTVARALNRKKKVSGPRNMLHGIPILVKESISAHGMNNTAGSYCLVGAKTKNEADLAECFSNLSVNPHNIHSINDLSICTKSHPKEEFPSRNIDFWEKVKDAPDFSSPEITAAFKYMRFLSMDGALDAVKVDAFILPSVICSDIPGLVGYPTITIPTGYLLNGTPITKNPRIQGETWLTKLPTCPLVLFSEEKLIGLAYAFE
ncbi:hypothetical protein BDZ45DRAFT_767570 [Acephala macrosclerotiorum]|nr:hypothetical protein BDZ45DRAFT_767570 [Acephala macrosclerotiorum]